MYPLFIDLNDRPVLVVGGGAVALRKIKGLLGQGARITVVARHIHAEIAELSQQGRITCAERFYRAGEAAEHFLVIGATDDDDVNAAVAKDAEDAGRLINIVDRPRLSNAFVPATVKRGDLQLSLSTGGKCPALARELRERLEGQFSPRYASLVDVLERIRIGIRTTVAGQQERARIIGDVVRSDAVERFIEGDETLLREIEKKWARNKVDP